MQPPGVRSRALAGRASPVLAGLVLAGFAAVGLWLWGLGGAAQLAEVATAAQRDVQNAIAQALLALRAGDPGALAGLWGLCFAYGFVHAAGPGHGKLVIGGYGVSTRVSAARLSGLALATSLAQAATAVALVYGAVFWLGWRRSQITTLADESLARLSLILIAAVGLWLVWRGIRQWRSPGSAAAAAAEPDPAHCQSCGHAHAPSPDQMAAVRSGRDALWLVGSIAIRPCTGAVFLLILTWRFGLNGAGIIGAFMMGLGTASLTVLTGLAAVGLRESLLQLRWGRTTPQVLALVQIAAGVLVVALALSLLGRPV